MKFAYVIALSTFPLPFLSSCFFIKQEKNRKSDKKKIFN